MQVLQRMEDSLSMSDRTLLIEIAHTTADSQIKKYALMELARYYEPPVPIKAETFVPYDRFK